MKKELYIAGYDFGQYLIKKKRFISPEDFEVYEINPIAICSAVPHAMMLVIRFRSQPGQIRMPVWFDQQSGYVKSVQYLGRMYRLWVVFESDPIINDGLLTTTTRNETIALLGDGYGMETP